MRNFLLFALDADGNTNVALLVVALDHNAYIRPVAVLLYAGIMISVNVMRDLIQHIAQESVLIVIPGGDGDDQITFQRIRMELERSCVAEDIELSIEIFIQISFSHFAELCVIGRLDALLLTDLGQYFLLFGWAAATAAGRQQGRAITPTRSRAANFFSFFIVKRLLSFQDFVDLSHFSAVFPHYRTGVVLA